MKTMLKTLFVSVASLSLMFTAYAGEVTVTGTAKATYNTATGTQNDNGIGIANELGISASGELDNGYSWTWAIALDPDQTDGSALNDDSSLTINTNAYGTIKICVSTCGNNKKYAFDQSVYGALTDTGLSEGITYPDDEGSYASLQYHTPELPFGTTLGISHGQQKADGASSNYLASSGDSMTGYVAVTKPIDGLTISASYYEVNQYADGVTGDEQNEQGGAYGIEYAVGNFSIGYGQSFKAPTIADTTGSGATTVEHYENTGLSLAYAVNDEFSVSYTTETGERQMTTSTTTVYDIEMDSFQVAYTSGGMTLSLARADYENVSYTNNNDQTETIVALSMAF